MSQQFLNPRFQCLGFRWAIRPARMNVADNPLLINQETHRGPRTLMPIEPPTLEGAPIWIDRHRKLEPIALHEPLDMLVCPWRRGLVVVEPDDEETLGVILFVPGVQVWRGGRTVRALRARPPPHEHQVAPKRIEGQWLAVDPVGHKPRRRLGADQICPLPRSSRGSRNTEERTQDDPDSTESMSPAHEHRYSRLTSRTLRLERVWQRADHLVVDLACLFCLVHPVELPLGIVLVDKVIETERHVSLRIQGRIRIRVPPFKPCKHLRLREPRRKHVPHLGVPALPDARPIIRCLIAAPPRCRPPDLTQTVYSEL